MKNTNRVRSDDGSSAPEPQTKRNPPKAAIILYDFEADNTITQQNLSHREFAALERTSQKVGMTMKQFIKSAVAFAVQTTEEIRPTETLGTKQQPGKSDCQSGECNESVGKIVLRNYWIKLGLSREELHGLTNIAELFKQARHRTKGNAAALVLTIALMHWDRLEPLFFADQRYSKAEGFKLFEVFCAETIARKFKLSSGSHGPRKQRRIDQENL